ncbi:MAG TPA: hypothetical protein VNO30_47280 [Kofleriaceae bacterium]|nr:hypothetical protein [Kofleriaceae bacterium]
MTLKMSPSLHVPKLVLVDLLAHASSAARVIGHLDGHLDDRNGATTLEQLSSHVDALVHGLGQLLGGHLQKTVNAEPAPEHDDPDMIDELRQHIARADALASTTDEQFSRIVVLTEGDDRRGFKRLAHLVEMTALAVAAASEASSKLIATVERARP